MLPGETRDTWVLEGATELPLLEDAIVRTLASVGLRNLSGSLRILPDLGRLDGPPYGLVSGPAVVTWRHPGATTGNRDVDPAGQVEETELGTGEPVRLLDRENGFVLTHALEDPYNFAHPNAAHFAQETRVVAQAMGHKPGAKYKYSAPPVFLFEPHQPEQCNYKPDLILKIDEVWEQKYKAFQILAAQKHLWGYYERVALNRGIQGSRNTGVPMTYGEAYQTLFPRVAVELG